MIQIVAVGLDRPTGALQTMRNLVGNGTGIPLRRMINGILKGKRIKRAVEASAKATIEATVYAAYTPEVYKRTRALINAVAWIPTTDVQPPKTPAMMLTIKHRTTGYRRLNFAHPKTNPQGTRAKYGDGTYAKFFLPNFQPSFLTRVGVPAVRNFFRVWTSTIPMVVKRRFIPAFHKKLVAAKAGL